MKWEIIKNHEGVYCGWEATGDVPNEIGKSGKLFFWSGPLTKDGKPVVLAEPETRILRTRLNIGSKIKNPYLSEGSLFPVLSDFISAKRLSEYYDKDHGEWDSYISEIERILKTNSNRTKYHVLLRFHYLRYVEGGFDDPWYEAAKEILGEMMIDACVSGWENLDLVTKAAKSMESKTDFLNPDIGIQEVILLSERKFLELLERVTLEIKEPPDQEIFFKEYCENGVGYRKAFDRLVKKLGFQWLPPGGGKAKKSGVR